MTKDGTRYALSDFGLTGYLDIGIIDTMKDLMVNFVGAVVFSFIGYFYVKKKGQGKIARQFIPVATEDPADAEADAATDERERAEGARADSEKVLRKQFPQHALSMTARNRTGRIPITCNEVGTGKSAGINCLTSDTAHDRRCGFELFILCAAFSDAFSDSHEQAEEAYCGGLQNN